MATTHDQLQEAIKNFTAKRKELSDTQMKVNNMAEAVAVAERTVAELKQKLFEEIETSVNG